MSEVPLLLNSSDGFLVNKAKVSLMSSSLVCRFLFVFFFCFFLFSMTL